MLSAVEAVAESWASMDGNLDPFKRERDGEIAPNDPTYTGHFDGYMVEAAEIVVRLKSRGYVLVYAGAPHG